MSFKSKPERFLPPEVIEALKFFALRHSGEVIKRTYVFGDIHGMAHHLYKLLGYINTSQPFDLAPSRFIFLGDYIDRGPMSAQVIAMIRLLQDLMPATSVIALKGNHEDMLLGSIKLNQGPTTISSNGHMGLEPPPDDVIEWMKNLPTIIEDYLHYYVHAGFDPEKSIKDQRDFDMLWIREPFLQSTKDFGKHVLHGHTPRIGGVEVRENRTNLDTGAVFGGYLTAAEIVNDQAKPLAFFYVNEKGCYFDRYEDV
jgi:serine/threonine protein phosphatase 1